MSLDERRELRERAHSYSPLVPSPAAQGEIVEVGSEDGETVFSAIPTEFPNDISGAAFLASAGVQRRARRHQAELAMRASAAEESEAPPHPQPTPMPGYLDWEAARRAQPVTAAAADELEERRRQIARLLSMRDVFDAAQ